MVALGEYSPGVEVTGWGQGHPHGNRGSSPDLWATRRAA